MTIVKEYYPNGSLKEEYTVVNNKKDGLYKKWWNNGHLFIQTTYVDGKENGEYKSWYRGADKESDNGQLFIQTTYIYMVKFKVIINRGTIMDNYVNKPHM
jgi:antitoxin component YwqK of YwqJK toxin-antitoxin module